MVFHRMIDIKRNSICIPNLHIERNSGRSRLTAKPLNVVGVGAALQGADGSSTIAEDRSNLQTISAMGWRGRRV